MEQKGKFPSSFNTEILIRALGDAGVKDIYEQYKAARKVRLYAKEPTAKEIRLASLVKKVGYSEAAKSTGVDVSFAYSALGRVAKYNFYQAK